MIEVFKKGWESLLSCLRRGGYDESFVQQQMGRVQVLDRGTLLRDSDKQKNLEREDRVPLVTTYHAALSSMMGVIQKLHPMLKSTEEHRKVFPEPPFVAFRRCKNPKDSLVRSKLYNVDNVVCDSRRCSPCRNCRC